MAWLVTHRGFVNTWECDENEHLNIQFYFARFADAAAHFLVGRGLAPFGPQAPRLLCRHVRFLRELGAANLTLVDSALADPDAVSHAGFALLHRLHEPSRGFVAAGALDLYAAPLAADLGPDRESPSEETQPHGLPSGPAGEPRSLADLLALGYRESERSVVQPGQLGPDGVMSVAAIVGRISDSAAQAWENAGIPPSQVDDMGRGRVALELKISPLRPARAGDAIVTVSGVTSVSRTAFHFREVLFDAASGEALAVSEKAALMIDQGTRKPVRLTEELRAAIEAGRVPE
jgi:acyl-CoA thioester hydrolase